MNKERRSDYGVKRPRHFQLCAVCGAEFHAPKSHKRKFCSPACAYKGRKNPNTPKKRGSKICRGCGREFALKTGGGTIYCSQGCASRHIAKLNFTGDRRFKRPRLKIVKLNCETCGKEIVRWKSNFQVDANHYCSLGCVNQSLRAEKTAKTNRANGHYDSSNCYSRCKRGFRTIGDKRIFFRSAMEADYARFLTFLGIKWEYESKTFWFDKIKSGTLSFTPDFFLTEEKRYVECKGWMDAKSKTKLKRMAKYYPDIKVELVDWKSFQGLCKGIGKVIPGWESGPHRLLRED